MAQQELSERDQRFVQAYSNWYANFVVRVLNAAARFLPRRALVRLQLLGLDIAEPLGGVVAAVYPYVRDLGDLVRWLVYG